MTLMKLAQLAGVSVGTVSKAFSGSREVGEDTKERIFELAKANGCFDKYYKNPRKHPLVALLFPEPESEFYARTIGLFEHAFRERGVDVVISFTRFDPAREAELFREFAYGMRVDGVVLSGEGTMICNPDELPLVTFSNRKHAASNSDAVRVDFEGGMRSLVQTVKDYGHTEVGFFGEALTAGKERSLRSVMREVGLQVQDRFFFASKKRFMEAGEDGMRALIERGALPSVIVTAYDQIAYGAMKYAKARGYRVPEDISFVGIDDISPTPYLGVPLCSLHIDFESVCDGIVELILRRMENRHYRSREEITVPVTVHIRESLKKIIK